MLKYLTLAAYAFAFAVLSTAGATAAPQDKSVMPDGSYRVADWNDRVCCRDNRQGIHWSTYRSCVGNGGVQVRTGKCRNDRDNRDWDDRWDQRWRNWDGDWDRRMCCQRGDRDWWSTPRDCRQRGGWMTRDRDCRNDEHDGDRGDRGDRDWNDTWDQRWRNWQGDWDRKICCQKGDRDWWSTPRDCRERGGWTTREDECRQY